MPLFMDVHQQVEDAAARDVARVTTDSQRELSLTAESRASCEAVYDTLVDAGTHLEWAGSGQPAYFRMRVSDSPGRRCLSSSPAAAGVTGFQLAGTRHDPSVVVRATGASAISIEEGADDAGDVLRLIEQEQVSAAVDDMQARVRDPRGEHTRVAQRDARIVVAADDEGR